MPDWYTTFNPVFATKGHASAAIRALKLFAEAAGIPNGATWRAFRRGIGVVVTAEWSHRTPGAAPASELNVIGGVPVLVEEKDDAEQGS
jgi:hypothetical protein